MSHLLGKRLEDHQLQKVRPENNKICNNHTKGNGCSLRSFFKAYRIFYCT